MGLSKCRKYTESSKITVRELISLGTVTYRNMIFPLDKERKESVQKIIEMVGLSEEADKQISKLSVGKNKEQSLVKHLFQRQTCFCWTNLLLELIESHGTHY